MAKGLGLIGNFRGKFGNAVGYNLKDSNNKQTQGIRIYQPIVKNPKTYAQAEQRAKLAPINATYRLLKAIIDRGQEGIAYGNKSRLAWLRDALKQNAGAWIDAGAPVRAPWLCALSKGSLPILPHVSDAVQGAMEFTVTGLTEQDTTINRFSGRLITAYPGLKEGDQLSFIIVSSLKGSLSVNVTSIVLSYTDDTELPAVFTVAAGKVTYGTSILGGVLGTVITSRLGESGQHLRSTSYLSIIADNIQDYYGDEAKEAAIRSYMAAGTTTDWPQEPIEE